MPPKITLCYVLVSRCGNYLWFGPGFRKIRDGLHAEFPAWKTRDEAKNAAKALQNAIGLESRVEAVSLIR